MQKGYKCKFLSILLVSLLVLTGCGSSTVDDFATNDGYDKKTETAKKSDADEQGEDSSETESNTGIAKEDIKVGVLHISDPAEGSGYSYTHDLGIQGMQENLGLSDDQIVRKLNVDDSDEAAIETALQECVDEGCNVIFTTSWGYMEPTARMEKRQLPRNF